MGKLDGINIHHSDQYHKKNEDIDMKNRRIDNLKTVCMTDNTTNLQYAINMECLLNYTTLQLSETLFWEYYQRADAFYHFPTSNTHELIFDSSTRKVSQLKDQSLSQNDAFQNTTSLHPSICSKDNRINKRYYIKFDGSQRMLSDINLNPALGDEDIVNVFLVYRLNSIPVHYWVNRVMGHDDQGYDKFIGLFTANLIISGTVNNFINIGTGVVNGYQPHAGFKNKANAAELNKWICLSVHWNIANETSFVYINGQQICQFQSRVSQGSNKLTIGDLNPTGVSGLDGYISSFLLYTNKRMTRRDILLHHHVLCSKWFNIDHDPITV